MLRWMTPFLVAIFAVGTAAAQGSGAAKPADAPAAATPADSPAAAKPAEPPATAKPDDHPAAAKARHQPGRGEARRERPPPRRAAVRAASQLPPGLPRAHYNYRTTVAPGAAPLYVRRGRALWWSRKRASRCC